MDRAQFRWIRLTARADAYRFSLMTEPIAVVVGAIAMFGVYAWVARYGIDLVDEGYFLDLATRVRHGQLPYRDFDTYYTPGMFYLNATVLALFGADVVPVRLLMVGLRTLCALVLYLLARRVVSPPFAAVPAVVLAATGFAAGSHPGWPALLGTLVMLAMIARVDGGARRWSLGLAGAAAGVAFLFKQNVGAFALVAALTYVGLRPRPDSGAFVVALRLLYAIGLGLTVAIFLRPGELFGASLWLPLVATLVLLIWGTSTRRPGSGWSSGLRAIVLECGWLGAGFGLVTLAWLAPLAAALGPSATPFGLFTGSVNQGALNFPLEPLPRGADALALASLWTPLAIAFACRPKRSKPVRPVMVTALVVLLLVWLRSRGDPADALPPVPGSFPRLDALERELGSLYLYLPMLAAWSGLALLTPRLAMRDGPPLAAWYLLVGTFAALALYPRADTAHALLAGAPLFLVGVWAVAQVHRTLAGGGNRFGRAALFAALLMVPAAAVLPLVYRNYVALAHPVPDAVGGTGYVPLGLDRATVLLPERDAESLRQVISFLRERTDPGEPVFAYPVDPLVNFLADRPNPTRFDHFLPGALSAQDMLDVVASLEAARPRYVVWDHGAVVFWKTDRPNRILSDYLWRCYEQVAVFDLFLVLEPSNC
jgi:hypothetical protein